MVMSAQGVQVIPMRKSPWDQIPEAIESLMSGVKAVRENQVFPQDIETLRQTSQDPATAQDPNTWLGLMGKLKTEKGKAMAYAQWQAMMKARSEYTTIYDPATGGVTQVPGKKVVVDKTAAEEAKDTRRFAQQDKLQNEKKELALEIEGLKTERQKTGITAANERQLKDLQKRDERLNRQLAAMKDKQVKETDIPKWAIDKATASLKTTDAWKDEKDEDVRAVMVLKAAKDLIKARVALGKPGEKGGELTYSLPKGGKMVPVDKATYDAYQQKWGLGK